jgi:hypothetical protein
MTLTKRFSFAPCRSNILRLRFLKPKEREDGPFLLSLENFGMGAFLNTDKPPTSGTGVGCSRSDGPWFPIKPSGKASCESSNLMEVSVIAKRRGEGRSERIMSLVFDHCLSTMGLHSKRRLDSCLCVSVELTKSRLSPWDTGGTSQTGPMGSATRGQWKAGVAICLRLRPWNLPGEYRPTYKSHARKVLNHELMMFVGDSLSNGELCDAISHGIMLRYNQI